MKIDLTDTQSAKLAEARQRAIEAATRARDTEHRYLDILAVVYDAHGIEVGREDVKILPDCSALIVPDEDERAETG